MKCLPGKLFIKFDNDSATIDKVTFANGQELFVDGSMNLEHNANSVAEVVYSGVPELKPGMKIGVSYHAVFAHDLKKDNVRIFHNKYVIDGQPLWAIKSTMVFCIIEGEEYKAFGDHCLIKPKYVQVKQKTVIPDFELTRNGEMVIKERGYWVSGNIPECQKGDEVYFGWSYRGETDFGYKNTFYVMPSRYIQCKFNA